MSLEDFEIALSNPWHQSFTKKQIQMLREVYTEGVFRGFHMKLINQPKVKPFEVKADYRRSVIYKRSIEQEKEYAERECRRIARTLRAA